MALSDTARLLASLNLDTGPFEAGTRRAGAALGGLEKRMGKIGGIASHGARTAGRNIERGLVVGITAAGAALGYSVKAAIDWESAFTGVAKTVDATAKTSLPQLEQQLLGLARTMPVTAEDLAQIAENAGAMGIKADDITEFTRQVAILGATTNVSTEQGAVALGQLQNIIGLTGDEFDNFTASLVALGNAGNSTEAQILEIERRSAGAAKLFGVAKEETLGWSAAAANLGLNQQLAGTSLQTLFIKLLPEYTRGTKKIQDLTGQTAAQIKKNFKEDASGSVEFLIKKLAGMPKAARLQAIQDLFGKGSGMIRLVNGLADSYDKNLKPSLDESVKAWKEAKAAQEEYNKRAVTTEAQLQIFSNNVKIAAATVGKELLPVLIDLAKEGVSWLDSHQQQIKDFAKNVGQGARDLVSFIKGINWDAIGGALKTGAGFAKGLIDAFLAAPPWLQGFLATGFIANKFTGGAVVSIVGEVGKGLLNGLATTFTRAGIGKFFVQPVFVTNPGFGAGGGGGVIAGGKGFVGRAVTGVGAALGGGAAIGTAALVASAGAIVTALLATDKFILEPQRQREAGENISDVQAVIASGDRQKITDALNGIKASVDGLDPLQKVLYELNANGIKTHTESLVGALEEALRKTPINQSGSPDERSDPNITKSDRAHTREEKFGQQELAHLRTIAKNTADDPEKTTQKQGKHFDRVRNQISESKVATIQKLQEGKAATQEVRNRIDVARAAQVAATIANAARVAAAEANSADRIVRALYATRAVTNVNVSVSGSGVVHNSYLNKAKNEGLANLP